MLGFPVFPSSEKVCLAALLTVMHCYTGALLVCDKLLRRGQILWSSDQPSVFKRGSVSESDFQNCSYVSRALPLPPAPFPGCSVPDYFLEALIPVPSVLFLFLFFPAWHRKAGGGRSGEEFPYCSWNHSPEFALAKSFLLESKAFVWRRLWTVFHNAYSSSFPVRPVRWSFFCSNHENLVGFQEGMPVKVWGP